MIILAQPNLSGPWIPEKSNALGAEITDKKSTPMPMPSRNRSTRRKMTLFNKKMHAITRLANKQKPLSVKQEVRVRWRELL
jgi:hypothetical protein